jgi:hypothetical protein
MVSQETAALKAVEEPDGEVEVDIDLDDLQDQLGAEAEEKPTTVRINGKIIRIVHAGNWPATAYRAMLQGDFDTWAEGVILNDKELKVWMDADLTLAEMEAVVTQCARSARLGRGKSQRQSGSSRNARRK